MTPEQKTPKDDLVEALRSIGADCEMSALDFADHGEGLTESDFALSKPVAYAAYVLASRTARTAIAALSRYDSVQSLPPVDLRAEFEAAWDSGDFNKPVPGICFGDPDKETAWRIWQAARSTPSRISDDEVIEALTLASGVFETLDSITWMEESEFQGTSYDAAQEAVNGLLSKLLPSSTSIATDSNEVGCTVMVGPGCQCSKCRMLRGALDSKEVGQ